MNIILDPGLLWFDKTDEHKNFIYLGKVINFIDTYLDIGYLPIIQFLEQLHTMAQDPLGEYREQEVLKSEIISKIWKNIDVSKLDKIISLNNHKDELIPNSFISFERKDIKDYLNNLWGLVMEDKYEVLFFLCRKNHKWNESVNDKTHFVHHIYKEIDSYISKLFSCGEMIKEENLKLPTIKSPLPNTQLCSEYSNIRQKVIRDGKADKETFSKLGKEVAYRNGYIFNEEVTRINSIAIREIFNSKTEPRVYLSIDFEKGAFEVCDHNGNHKGEFSYEGIQTAKAKADHSIKIKK